MLQTRGFTKYWLPVIAWMLLIFCGSGDVLSTKQTSRFLGPMIHWLLPRLSDERVQAMVTVVRKGGHVTEYGVLALLVWWARRKTAQQDVRRWEWPDARFALAVAFIYAMTDEFHQAFVPSRQGSMWDVLLDTSGAAVALLILWAIVRRRSN
jgi:VanZ family protein